MIELSLKDTFEMLGHSWSEEKNLIWNTGVKSHLHSLSEDPLLTQEHRSKMKTVGILIFTMEREKITERLRTVTVFMYTVPRTESGWNGDNFLYSSLYGSGFRFVINKS